MGNRLVVVDVANIRPDYLVRRGRFGQRTERDQEVLTSIAYVDSLLLAISGEIPNASVVAIADRVLQHRLESPNDQKIFRERTQLPVTDPEFIYLMPPQRVQQKSRRFWGRRFEGDVDDFVEADELILAIAAASEGLVISGDYYRDFKYRSLADWLATSHYLPVNDALTGEWLLCAKPKAMELSGRDRKDAVRMRSIAGVDSAHRGSTVFDLESDSLLRRHVFETIIPQFWSDRNTTARTFTIGDRSPTVFRPFATLRLPQRSSEVVDPRVLEPKVEAIKELVAEPDNRVPDREPEPAATMATPTQVRRRLAKTLWASNSSSNLRYLDQVVRMIGQVFPTTNGTQVLRWVYPSGSIRIVGDVPSSVRRAIDVIMLQGLLRLDGDELVLDVNVFATRQVEDFNLHNFYHRQILKVRERHMRPKIRRWSPPVPSRYLARSDEVFSPNLAPKNEPDFHESRYDPKPYERVETVEVVRSLPGETAAKTKRRRGRIAVFTALVVALVIVVSMVRFLAAGNDSISQGRMMRNLEVVTAPELDGPGPKTVYSATTNVFHRDGKLVVRW